MKTKILFLIAFLAAGFYSCQENDGLEDATTAEQEELVLKSAEMAEEDITTERVMEEINFEADFYAESEHLLRRLARLHRGKRVLQGLRCARYHSGNFPDVSVDTAETRYPIVITIDYGDSTALKNGHVISGIITIEITGPRGEDGSGRNITFDIMIDDIVITGAGAQKFHGDNETERVITSYHNLLFNFADTLEVERTGRHMREWISGIDTPLEQADDSIAITGASEIAAAPGNTWTRTILEPIIKVGDCRHPVSGVVEYELNGTAIAELDYGDGECDNLAILTVNGEEIEIELGGKRAKADVQHRRRMSDKNDNRNDNRNGNRGGNRGGNN